MNIKASRDPLRYLLAPAAAVLLAFGCGSEESSPPDATAKADSPVEVPAAAPAAAPAVAPAAAPVQTPPAPSGRPVPHDHDGDGVPDHATHEDVVAADPTPEEGEAQEEIAARAAAVQSAGARPGKPRLDVDNPEHDFGTAIEGERLVHTFTLRSTGDADLVINSAKPTCGCTVAKLVVLGGENEGDQYKMGDPIPKGTDIELTARLDTKNKHNIASSKINIFCNDPRSTVTLGLKTQVDQYFQISPGSLAFGELSVADVVDKSFTVSGKKPGPFLLSLDGRTTPPGVQIDLEPESPTEAGKAEVWNVKVTIGPDAREGNLGYPVQLRSDEEVKGAAPIKGGEKATYGASVMVTARIRGLISWEPQYLSFGLVRPGQVVARSLSVSSFDEEFVFDTEAVSIELTGPNEQKPDFQWGDHFSHVITPSEDGKSFRLELTLDGLPDEADGSFQGRVMIKTGPEQKQEIPVLFSGVCRPGVVRGR
jgi:hypothetical protein